MSRYLFLSSSVSSVIAGSAVLVLPGKDRCEASAALEEAKNNLYDKHKDNPRYLEYELDMKYAEDSSGNPRTRGVFVRRFTGDNTPYTFPVRPIRLVKEWPAEPPFQPEDFFRADSNDDGWFYSVPRLVYHIDEPAVAALTQYYRKNIPLGSSILDICSSWVSHYPLEFNKVTMKLISGTGMNKYELMANDQLTDFSPKNLNDDPSLEEYPDNTFDFVTCVVSIDYLIHPIEVLREVHRVLKPGGKVIISQSNRCFPSKAIAMWLKMNDRQHLELINGYFQYAGGFKSPRKAFDITAEGLGSSSYDPIFILQAEKES
jgi:SAM-dependent methyltransferase